MKADKREKHPMLEPCSCKKLKCITKIDENRRTDVHRQFWEMTYKEQGIWLMQKVKPFEIQRRRPRKKSGKPRHFSYKYFLEDSKRNYVEVCQNFFKYTLGYSSNKKFLCLFNNLSSRDIASPEDQLGRQPSARKWSEIKIQLS